MDKVELYRQVFRSFKELCAEGRQPSTFGAYCRDHGVSLPEMRDIIREEFPDLEIPPGRNCMGRIYSGIYEDFKALCSEGLQSESFASYCRARGISHKRMHYYMKDHGLKVVGLPGYTGPTGAGGGKSQDIPFEDVIFEEAGFLPADGGNVITVRVGGHVAVSFPADTDVAVIARFVRKMGKEDGDVGA